MKKKILIVSTIFIVLLIALTIKPIVNFATQKFWDFVAVQLDKEEQARIEAIERGEIVRGKDTMLIWENQYVLYHQAGDDILTIHHDDGTNKGIIGKVTAHKIKNNKLYILSDEGFAVVDRNNFCRVLITVPADEFVCGYAIDEEGTKTYLTRFIEHEDIKYLSAFDNFSEEEQEVLHELTLGVD